MKICVLTNCSDYDPTRKNYVASLTRALEQHDVQVLQSTDVFNRHGKMTPEEKAEELNSFFTDPRLDCIYDMSGGNVANEILPYLDYETIGKSRAVFYGYSDLTVLLNGIYAKTGKEGILWSVMTLLQSASEEQRARLDNPDMYRFRAKFLQGDHVEGTMLGGNIRCFLKLAGTPYFPDLRGKLLLLEARSGEANQIRTYFAQLQQMGVFDQVGGVILGTFTALESRGPDPWELLKTMVPEALPVAKTAEIGHGPDSRAARIGAYYRLNDSFHWVEPAVKQGTE